MMKDKKRLSLALLLFFSLLLSACKSRSDNATQTPPMPASVSTEVSAEMEFDSAKLGTVSYDLPYAMDSESQKLDIYYPDSIEISAPVMIYVHGGAWVVGDKSAVQFKDDVFNEAGYIFISINYRLSPDATWQEMADDVATAIAWVYENIPSHGGNPQRIFLMGHSAGAHLVSLVATDESYLQNIGLNLDILQGVVSLDTRAYNIPALKTNRGTLPSAYASIFGDALSGWESASPLFHVVAGKNIPPMAMAWSKGMLSNSENAAAREIPTREFFDALNMANIPAILVDGSTKTHAEINRQFGKPGDTLTETIMDWLNQLR